MLEGNILHNAHWFLHSCHAASKQQKDVSHQCTALLFMMSWQGDKHSVTIYGAPLRKHRSTAGK